MSTAAPAPAPSAPLGTLDISKTSSIPLMRLVKVEMRKMLDTRAGLWLIIAIVAITALITIIFFFAAKGGTVLLSSHLLHEVEMIADEMVLIGRGKIVAQGTKAELLHTVGTYVKPEDPAALQQALAAAGIAATPSGDGGFRSEAEQIDVGRAAAAAGVVLIDLRRAEGAGLEEMFLQLTSGDARESVTSEGAQV